VVVVVVAVCFFPQIIQENFGWLGLGGREGTISIIMIAFSIAWVIGEYFWWEGSSAG